MTLYELNKNGRTGELKQHCVQLHVLLSAGYLGVQKLRKTVAIRFSQF